MAWAVILWSKDTEVSRAEKRGEVGKTSAAG